MLGIVDLTTYPLDQRYGEKYALLLKQARADLVANGMFNLPGFLTQAALNQIVQQLSPRFAKDAFHHARHHNIYFRNEISELPKDHPALAEHETANSTLCADQLVDTALDQIYVWPAFAAFLADVMEKPALYPMQDRLARVNAMSYGEGEALNWHFDRSEFTTTLLLQSPDEGGEFEYASDLRSDEDPNYQGVADLLAGKLPIKSARLAPGTLNVFRGKNTAHRVTPSHGPNPRMIAVFSYFEQPGMVFSAKEQLGFYGRIA